MSPIPDEVWQRCWVEPIKENWRQMRAKRAELPPDVRWILDALVPIPDPDEPENPAQ